VEPLWAETQSNLSNLYRRQGEQASGEEAHKLLEKAVEASGHVLEVVTKEAQPDFWARTQVSLARCFADLAHWMEDAGRGPEKPVLYWVPVMEIQNLRLARKALESASEVYPDLRGDIQKVDSEIDRVSRDTLKKQ
jgi:hypothetical protein